MHRYLLNSCDLCHNEYPILKYDIYHEKDNSVWIEYNGRQFLCNHCCEERKYFDKSQITDIVKI